MVYITGDLHGNQWEWLNDIEPLLHSGDTILFAGDFGFGMMYGPLSEEMFYDRIEEKNITLLFADGNHENFDRLNAYPVETFRGGKVHKIRKNVLHLMRGEVFDLEGSRVFVFGGGFSLDKARRQEGVSWWSQELPSEEEYRNAEEHLCEFREQNHPIDFIVTHTAPSDSIYYLSRIPKYGVRNDITEDWELVAFLDRLSSEWNPKKWYFGHYHVDRELLGNQIALLHAIRELKTGRIVGWKAPNNNTRD